MSLEQALEERIDALLQQGTLLAYLAELAVGSHKVRDRGTKSQPNAVRHLKGKLTKFVIEDAGAEPLDACEEFIGASRIVSRVQSARPLAGLSFLPNIVVEDPNGHPQEVSNGFLKGKDGVSLGGLTDLCRTCSRSERRASRSLAVTSCTCQSATPAPRTTPARLSTACHIAQPPRVCPVRGAY
jgi:hypothetical protein